MEKTKLIDELNKVKFDDIKPELEKYLKTKGYYLVKKSDKLIPLNPCKCGAKQIRTQRMSSRYFRIACPKCGRHTNWVTDKFSTVIKIKNRARSDWNNGITVENQEKRKSDFFIFV